MLTDFQTSFTDGINIHYPSAESLLEGLIQSFMISAAVSKLGKTDLVQELQ